MIVLFPFFWSDIFNCILRIYFEIFDFSKKSKHILSEWMGSYCHLEFQSAIEKKSCYYCCYYFSLYIILILFILILYICIVYVFVCVCVSMTMCICECRCPQRQEESVGAPGPRFTDGCELSNVGAGNWTVFCYKASSPAPVYILERTQVYLVCCRENSRYGIAEESLHTHTCTQSK